ncbi:hypothetical protein SAMN05443377_1281 [Propionibacterium cyclohexanicum]|uniref:Acyl carrier protein n=2 Tax=Propionibacterium cyclohexanicum TaxID=64702 RepID=A0A1H9TTK3_9ACTN|nr:hypothetical protein SAMN05443377_1281 [Propionibacterium cyclohexanicum]
MATDPRWVARVLAEFDASPPRTGDAHLDLIATAIFLEDVFAISVRDEEITAELMGSPTAVGDFVRTRLGLG